MNNVSFTSLFPNPLMEVQLDLDLEKLTEFAFEILNKDKKGVETNGGGWQSNDIREEKNKEFKKLKKEINHLLQIYYSEIFRGMEFREPTIQNLNNMWVTINEKHQNIEWHLHGFSTLSGVYYIKHDGVESGDILFKHPVGSYMERSHWPVNLIKTHNEITASVINIMPKPNMLLIFPSWLDHKVETNLENDSRISISFNSTLSSEKK